MNILKFIAITCSLVLLAALQPCFSSAWFDETHLAVAKVAGYKKWFNAAGPDVAKLKMGHKEGHNHFVNNPRGTVVTTEMVLAQVDKYNHVDPAGHLYGAIIASVRDYIETKMKGCTRNITLPMRPITSETCLSRSIIRYTTTSISGTIRRWTVWSTTR